VRVDPADLLEPPDHSGDPAADPAAVDRGHRPDRRYRAPGQEEARGIPNVDRE
jgi:hypothetical protein